MKITNKLKGNEVRFSELDRGIVFKCNTNSHVYMKMYEVESEYNEYNVVDLTDGDVTYFSPTEMVEPLYDAELVI